MNHVTGLEDLHETGALKTAYGFNVCAPLWHNAQSGGLGFGLLCYAFLRNLRPHFALAIEPRYGFIETVSECSGKGKMLACFSL